MDMVINMFVHINMQYINQWIRQLSQAASSVSSSCLALIIIAETAGHPFHMATLWKFDIAIEHAPFTDELAIVSYYHPLIKHGLLENPL